MCRSFTFRTTLAKSSRTAAWGDGEEDGGRSHGRRRRHATEGRFPNQHVPRAFPTWPRKEAPHHLLITVAHSYLHTIPSSRPSSIGSAGRARVPRQRGSSSEVLGSSAAPRTSWKDRTSGVHAEAPCHREEEEEESERETRAEGFG